MNKVVDFKLIDGKGGTLLDPNNEPDESLYRQLRDRFGERLVHA